MQVHRLAWKALHHLVGNLRGRTVVYGCFHGPCPWCRSGHVLALRSTSSTSSASIHRMPCTTFGVRVPHHQHRHHHHHHHHPLVMPQLGPSFWSCPIGLDRPLSRFDRTFEREVSPTKPKRFPFEATSRPKRSTTTKANGGRRGCDDASDALHAHDDEADFRPPILAWWKEVQDVRPKDGDGQSVGKGRPRGAAASGRVRHGPAVLARIGSGGNRHQRSCRAGRRRRGCTRRQACYACVPSRGIQRAEAHGI
mmetsp:Transcript_5321/g.33391  ORF Transcript_5321/g.33391 Transcript_5321/m.33391 type:complete len:252 (+) Transcript_5321:778-1533(+)